MKVFVTGGSGLLGSKIAEISVERGYKVYSGYNAHKPNVGVPVKLDLTNHNSIKAIKEIEPDVVVHS
ncbi:MAG: NAD-dependent epimerase/dehydratase family protein, partial [Archaeoglobaceae archaeon]